MPLQNNLATASKCIFPMANNWLSFTLQNHTRDALHEISKIIEHFVAFRCTYAQSLHMTAVFLGKQVKSKDVPLLFETMDDVVLSGEFKFNKLMFFPPGNGQLIVAQFDCSANVKPMLSRFKQSLRTTMNYQIDHKTDKENYIAHVTLGKVMIGKNDLKHLKKSNILEQIMETFRETFEESHLDMAIDSENPVYMCGAVPL